MNKSRFHVVSNLDAVNSMYSNKDNSSLLANKEFLELFKKKKRLCCSKCGDVNFDLTPTDMPNITIEEAIFMTCINCGHKRLELV